MSRLRHIILLVTALALLSPTAHSQVAPQRPVLRIDDIDARTPPTVHLYLTELDATREVKPTPDASDYRLLVNALPQKVSPTVQPFGELGEPLALVLVIQVSPAMKPVFDRIIAGCTRLIDGLPADALVGLIAYADAVEEQVMPTSPVTAKSALKQLSIQDDALALNLPFAVQEAMDALKGKKLPRRRVIVVISDGLTAELSLATFSKLARAARNERVKLHTIGYAPLEPAGLRTLHELSGGSRADSTFRPTLSLKALDKAFEALREELREQRVLTYTLPQFFRGEVADFQISVDNLESEPVEVELLKWEGEARVSRWVSSPVFFILVIALSLVGLTAGGFFFWRQRHKRLQTLYAESEAGDEQTDGTAATAEDHAEEDVGWQTALPDALPHPTGHAPAAPVAPPATQTTVPTPPTSFPPVSLAPPPSEQPPLAPPPSAITPPSKPRPPSGEVFSLPSPTQFMRKVEGKDGVVESVKPLVTPTVNKTRSEPTAPIPPLMPTDPLLAPGSPSADKPFSLGRTTQVMSPEEVSDVDLLAWVVPLSTGQFDTLVLREGFTVGTKEDEFRVLPQAGQPEGGVFRRNSAGEWTVTTHGTPTAARTVLHDNDRFQVGAVDFVFKTADRMADAPEQTRAWLQVVGGLDDGRQIALRKGIFASVGTHQSCTASIRGTDIGPRHLVAWIDREVCHVADLGVASGIKLNERLVGKAELQPGDDVQVGSVRLVYRLDQGQRA